MWIGAERGPPPLTGPTTWDVLERWDNDVVLMDAHWKPEADK